MTKAGDGLKTFKRSLRVCYYSEPVEWDGETIPTDGVSWQTG